MHTDFFDNPIAVGDEIIYPVAAGSSSATYARAKIEAFIALVPHRGGHGDLMREDQANKSDPTRFRAGEYIDRPYLIKMRTETWSYMRPQGAPLWSEKSSTLRRVGLAIRVPNEKRLEAI